jgi:hypothetical protein
LRLVSLCAEATPSCNLYSGIGGGKDSHEVYSVRIAIFASIAVVSFVAHRKSASFRGRRGLP